MVPLTALVIALLLAIIYWFATALPMKAGVRQVAAGVGAVLVFVLLLSVIGILHLAPR